MDRTVTPILIDGAFVVADGGAREGAVLVRDGVVSAVAYAEEDRAALRQHAGETVDARGRWLMPGLMDAHAHGYSALLRGTENSMPLELWALYTTLYGRAYDAESLRAAILLGAAERIRGGITGTVDHSPMVHLAQHALAAHEASGIRVAYAPFLHDVSDYDLMRIDLPPALAAIIGGPPPVDHDRYAGAFASLVEATRAGSGRVQIQLGPNAPQRCSPELWALWRRLRERHDVGVHTHLLETRAQAALNPRWPGGLVAAMAREGMLEGRLTCAHGVWLSDAEREVLARHDVTLSHNPASNLMLGSGIMPIRACTACGLRLALGTDSANTGGRHDIFAVMRLAMMLPRAAGTDFTNWPVPAEVFGMATEGAAAALGLAGRVGRIAPGQLADLVLVRAEDSATIAGEASLATLVQHAGPEHVESVMVAGAWVMREGRILAFDEDAVRRDARTLAAALQAEAAAAMPMLAAAIPSASRQLARVCG